ncbi:MAG: ubiquitin-conjugating enzyme E2 [Candidatus Heimdallarchaeota archaeon]
MLTTEEFYDRLSIEADELIKEEPTFQPVEGTLTMWQGYILGPQGCYEEGVFRIMIKIPREYPFLPPRVQMLTPIWHPNIRDDGRVCVGLLGKDWTPANTLVEIVEVLRFLLDNPNPDDPLNPAAAREFKHNFSKFCKKAKEFVIRYATWEHVQH